MNDFNAKFSKRFILLFPVLFALVLCACRKEESPAAPVSPFSDSTWGRMKKEVYLTDLLRKTVMFLRMA